MSEGNGYRPIRGRKIGTWKSWWRFVGALFAGLIVAQTAAGVERIFVNHLGYLPGESKCVVASIPQVEQFRVLHASGEEVAFEGELRKAGGAFTHYVAGDSSPHAASHTYVGREQAFGPCVVGDFSALRKPGVYRIQIGEPELFVKVGIFEPPCASKVLNDRHVGHSKEAHGEYTHCLAEVI